MLQKLLQGAFASPLTIAKFFQAVLFCRLQTPGAFGYTKFITRSISTLNSRKIVTSLLTAPQLYLKAFSSSPFSRFKKTFKSSLADLHEFLKGIQLNALTCVYPNFCDSLKLFPISMRNIFQLHFENLTIMYLTVIKKKTISIYLTIQEYDFLLFSYHLSSYHSEQP